MPSKATETLVDGIVSRAVERAYNGALSVGRGHLLSRRHFDEMADHLRDEIILALRTVRTVRRQPARKSVPKMEGR